MQQFISELEDSRQTLCAEAARLTADERRDESDLMKIRANVYGICVSILRAVGMEKGRERICGLQSIWETALEAARTHNDPEKAFIEEVKLEALGGILKRLSEVA